MLRAAAAAASKPSSKLFTIPSVIARSLATTSSVCSPATILSRLSGSGGGEALLFSSSWSVWQLRHARFSGADVRPGNVIERKGKIYEVVKAQHSTQGRGGAIIQVELRDVDSGNKVNERLRTDESIERVYVEEKAFSYLYTEDDVVVLLDPDSFMQMNVPSHFFGESLPYLRDDMKVTVQVYDNKPMSASIPQKVTWTVAEAEVHVKGSTAAPQYKRVKLENGLTVQVPTHVLAGDKIIINATDHSYVGRA